MEPLEEAAKLAGEGRHEEAVELCRKAASAGLRAEGYAAMASSYEALGMHEKAAECLQKSDRAPSLRKAALLYRAGRHAKAASEAGKILREAPGEPGALAVKALALVGQNMHAAALECCADVSDPRVLAAKGRALYETGDLGGAARCCKEAGAGFSALFYAALSLEGEEAQKYYEEAALQEPDDTDSPRASMGVVMWRLGRTAEALEELDLPGDPKAACIRGQVLKEAGKAEASDWFRNAAKCRSENWEGLYYVGLACHMLGLDGDVRWHQKAAKALKASQARNRSSPAVAELLADAEKESGRRLREAEDSLRRPEPEPAPRKPKPEPKPKPRAKKKKQPAAPRLPDAEGIVRRAKELCEPGSCEKALAALDELAVPDRQRADAQFCRGMAHYGLAKYEEAQACFEKAGSGLEATYWSAMSLFRLGLTGMLEVGRSQKAQRYRDAKRLLDRILGADPLYPGARTLSGLVEYHSSRSIGIASGADARRSFGEALKADPSDAVALYHMGQALDHGGDASEANRMYGLAAEAKVEASGFDSWPSYCKGYALDLLGQYETALSVYLDALALDPDYGPGFAEQMREARGKPPEPHYNMQSPDDGRLDVCIVDTNVSLPHLVRSFLQDDVREWMNLAYHRKKFWTRLQEGSYVIPAVCRYEIIGQLNSDFLAKYAPRASRLRVTDGVKDTLDGLPRTRWSEEAGSAGPRDVMRIRRAYWRAWFAMSREAKEKWSYKKRRGGRPLAGGPPMGARDSRILAIAAKIASGGSSVGLVTDDNDFLMFGSAIKELDVDVVEV